MTQNYTRGELPEICNTFIGSYIGFIICCVFGILWDTDKRLAFIGGVLVSVGLVLCVISLICFCRWIIGLTQRIDDTAINTAKTNETLVLILNELKLMREVETKHKQHFDTYADWMSDTMCTINNNIIKTWYHMDKIFVQTVCNVEAGNH